MTDNRSSAGSAHDAWSAATHDEIIKRLMADVGMPNSVSLYGAFKQFANELHALAQSPVNERLADFFKWAMREGPWEGSDLDGGSVQEKAEELGLIVKTKYDAKTHGPSNWMFEDGDDYYVFASEIAAQPPAAPALTSLAEQSRQQLNEWIEERRLTPAAPVGLFASLTPEQQKAALEYDGPENHGEPAAPVEMVEAGPFPGEDDDGNVGIARCSADTNELRQHEETFFRLIRSLLTDVATAKLGVTSVRANDLLHKLKHLNDLRAALTNEPQTAWTCFHCSETFTDPEVAKVHFGDDLSAEPGCKLSAMEGGLLKIVRDQEEELRQFRRDETASYREFYSLGADHSQALIREEQKGYDKGLADARVDFEKTVRSAPCLDENGYICEKAAILNALNGTSPLSRPHGGGAA